jgi:hypothetical protein
MDYHRQFRMGGFTQFPSRLGQPGRTRLPRSSVPPTVRHFCNLHEEQEGEGAATTEPVAPTHAVPVRDRATPGKLAPRLQAQVNQFKFWLKVFSRFCQDSSAD